MASMAICRPRTIGDAPEGPERSGGCRRSDPRLRGGLLSCLARNGRSPGEESRFDGVAAQTIEAQPVFGQIEPSQRPGDRVLNHKSGRRWPASVRPGKRSVRFGVGKETREGESDSRRRKANRKRLDPAATSMCTGDAINATWSKCSEEGRNYLLSSSLLRFRPAVSAQPVRGRGLRKITSDASRLRELAEDRSRLPRSNPAGGARLRWSSASMLCRR